MKKQMGLLVALLLSGAVTAAAAQSQTADKRLYVAPSFSYSLADDDRLTDDGLGGQLSVGKRITRGLNLELTSFYSVYKPDEARAQNFSDKDATFKGVGLGAMLFPFTELQNLYGILAVYEGFTDDGPCNTRAGQSGCRMNYKSTVFDSGVGYLLPLGNFLSGASVRFEARYRMDSHNSADVGAGGQSEHYDGVFNVGLQIPLGHYAEEEPAEEENVEVVDTSAGDSDNDGVPDDSDRCPGTPAGAIVDEFGCETDEDGDGVVDRLDRCPGTPAGTPVDENGCPVKSCRPPFPGEPVDADGCATGDTFILRGVNFEFDKSRLTSNAQVILDGVADTLLAVDDIDVEIGGHTDSRGSDAYNQKLSEERAKSVRAYLIERGVDGARMTTRGYGESQPIADNNTDDGRELNRRVELKIQTTPDEDVAAGGIGTEMTDDGISDDADLMDSGAEESTDDAATDDDSLSDGETTEESTDDSVDDSAYDEDESYEEDSADESDDYSDDDSADDQ